MRRADLTFCCLVSALVASTSGCVTTSVDDAGGESGDTSTGGDADAESGSVDGGDGDGDEGGEAESTFTTDSGDTGEGGGPVAEVSGSVCDVDGALLGTAAIQLCTLDNITCLSTVNEEGNFAFSPHFEGSWALKVVHADTEGEVWSSQTRRIEIVSGQDVVIEDCLVLPKVGAVTDLSESGPTTVVVDEALSVDVDPASLEYPFGFPTVLGGVEIPASAYPYGLGTAEDPVVAIWAFAIYGAHVIEGGTAPKAVFTAPVASLAPYAGQELAFYDIDKLTGDIAELGTGSVDADGNVSADIDIHHLSWLFVTAR